MSIMTVGQAIVKFLDNQYVELDGVETKFVDGVFTIFGHGIVVGLGQALDEVPAVGRLGGPDDLLPGESNFRRHRRIPSPSR